VARVPTTAGWLALRKSPKKMAMTEDERREVLEGIARDEDAYPRDRIAAIKTLMEIVPPEPDTDIWAELDALAPRRNRRTEARPDGAG
jgi:hypothetical protein